MELSNPIRNLLMNEYMQLLFANSTFEWWMKGNATVFIQFCSLCWLKIFELNCSIGFESIMKMNVSEERLIVVLKKVSENSKLNFIHFFLSSSDAAKAMHKAAMEHQLFFYSSKVRQSVLNHYLLSTPCWALPAKWFTKMPPGELFHLDVKHTRRQAYDLHYEKVHEDSDSVFRHNWVSKCSNCTSEEANALFTPCGHLVYCSDCAKAESACPVCNTVVTSWQRVYFSNDSECDDWTCQICMDSEINTAFSPCGHVCACEKCSCHLPYCPMCKTFITFVQRIHVQFPEQPGESDDDDGYNSSWVWLFIIDLS